MDIATHGATWRIHPDDLQWLDFLASSLHKIVCVDAVDRFVWMVGAVIDGVARFAKGATFAGHADGLHAVFFEGAALVYATVWGGCAGDAFVRRLKYPSAIG